MVGVGQHLRCIPLPSRTPSHQSCAARRPLAVGFSGGHLTVRPNSPLWSPFRPAASLPYLFGGLAIAEGAAPLRGHTFSGAGCHSPGFPGLPSLCVGLLGWPGAMVWWRAVASTDGICGSLTCGHPSSSDSWESRGCGFRPLRGRAVPVVFLLGPACRSPAASLSGVAGACGGPGFGETSGGIMDGLGGCAWYAGTVFRGQVSQHLFHGSPSALPPFWRGGAQGRRQGRVRASRAPRWRVVSG